MKTSESLMELAKALSQAQSEIKNTPATKENPHFRSRYTPLDDVLDMARSVLPKHGLTVLQGVSGASETISVVTRILHVSGEWIESDPLVMKAEKGTPQGQGSAITYARRYSLSGILGIATDPDDDGNEAAGKVDTKVTEKPAKPTDKPQQNPPAKDKPEKIDNSDHALSDKVTKADLAPIIEICKNDPVKADKFRVIYKGRGYAKAEHILKADFPTILGAFNATTKPDDDTPLPFTLD